MLRDLIAAIRASDAPAGVKTRIVAVDGAGGAGKSSLAELLARRLDAPIVHTDDFASWENPVDWWPELRRGLERDGLHARAQWEEWMEAEDRYVERERPAEHADRVLPGDRDWWD